MSDDIKPTVNKEETFDKLEIRVGRVLTATREPTSPKPAYNLVIDFGKFGRKRSVGRFTHHTPEELVNQLVVAVINFPARLVGGVESEVLVLGTQYPKTDSGEATFLSPKADSKIGGKVF